MSGVAWIGHPFDAITDVIPKKMSNLMVPHKTHTVLELESLLSPKRCYVQRTRNYIDVKLNIVDKVTQISCLR